MSVSETNTPDSFAEVFAPLRALLTPFARRLYVAEDTGTVYTLFVAAATGKQPPTYFASVGIRKSYVSFHLPPTYYYSELLDDLPAALRARMQGKTCFNFKRVETERFAELADLVKKTFAHCEAEGLILPQG